MKIELEFTETDLKKTLQKCSSKTEIRYAVQMEMDKQVRAAVRRELNKFIKTMPHGLDELIKEALSKISFEEELRLEIMRGFQQAGWNVHEKLGGVDP